MLKKIPPILNPSLLKKLAESGHGDEIVIADGNFPSASIGPKVIRCDGHDIPSILEAILQLLPLDQYVKQPVQVMACPDGDVPVWSEYKKIIKKSEGKCPEFKALERFEFYKAAKNAFLIIISSDLTLYANIILKRGVIKE